MIGRTLNEKYHIVAEIGTGGMGTVYHGEHLGLKKKVALKVLHSDLLVSEESLQRFQREGIAAGKFNHPNAIQIFDFDRSEDGALYLAMEFIEGPNLKAFLARKGRLAPAAAVDLIVQVLGVLAEAHANGIIHRDLKPDNIMVVESASGALTVKVLDFGLSKLVDIPLSTSLQTQAGRLLGTPLYMAPEQCAGEEADVRSDLYAVGLILYELLTGITAFPDQTATEIIFTRPKREAPSMVESHPNIGVPAALDAITSKALQRRREDRYQTAEEMLSALDEIRYEAPFGSKHRSAAIRRSEAVAGAAQASPAASSESAQSKFRWKWGAIGAVVVLGLIVALTAFMKAGGPVHARLSDKPEADRTPDEVRYVILLEQTEDSLLRDDPDAALGLAQRAVRMECVDSEAFYLRARSYRAKNEREVALEDLREALVADPNYLDALVELGWLQYERNEMVEARAAFEQAIALDPLAAAGLAGKGAALQREGKHAEAKQALAEAVELDPSSGVAQLHYGELLLAEDDLPAARTALLHAKRNGSQAWRADAALGALYLREGNSVEAQKSLRSALDQNPRLSEVRYQLVATLLESGRHDAAEETLLEGLRRDPTAGRLQVLRGIVNESAGDRSGAIVALEKGLRTNADDARAQTLLGLLYQEEGRNAEALQAFDKAVELDDSLFAAQQNRGLVLFALERMEEAAEALEKAVRLAPEDAYTRYSLGILYMEYLGASAEALTHLSAYQELDGSDPRVRGWLRKLGG